MLNYIWAGLIICSLGFALWTDFADIRADRYRNGQAWPVILKVKQTDAKTGQSDVDVIIDGGSYSGTLVRTEKFTQLRISKDAALPQPLATIRDFTNDEKELRARVMDTSPGPEPDTLLANVQFDPVRFVKVKAITNAAFEFAKTAVTFSLGLIGTLALWLGLMKIAEASGLIAVFVRLVQPILRPLFPQIPAGHPALGMIALNLAANVLGLGNAATPMGLKAMEELQKLNPSDDTATDPMVMLMAINTAGVQLVPPATLVAILGLGVAELFVPILLVTGLSLAISIVACKIFERLPAYRRTNPNLRPIGEGGAA